MSSPTGGSPVELRDLPAEPISDAAFLPFGRLISATPDGTPAGEIDRALDLRHGTPRFYIMALTHRGYRVDAITRHRHVTQVLAAVGGRPWMVAVAPPAEVPALAQLRGFSIPGDVAVLLHAGTWHAGPYFADAEMKFFNLEAEDTNVVDHDTCLLSHQYGCAFALRDTARL